MYLRKLKATNWSRDEYQNNDSTNLYVGSEGTENSNLLHRAARLKIEVNQLAGGMDDYVYEAINPVYDDPDNYFIWQDYDYIEENDGWGYWTVDMDRLTISGYPGDKMYKWLSPTDYPYQIDSDNPLKETEFHFESEMSPYLNGHGHTFMEVTPYIPWGPISNAGVTWYEGITPPSGFPDCTGAGWYCPGYKVFTEEKVKQYGHKNVQTYIDENGTNNLTAGPGCNIDQLWMGDYTVTDVNSPNYGLAGIWYDETGQSYTGPGWTAADLWSPDVEKVIMFDSSGLEMVDTDGSGAVDTLAGKQGNHVDIFVIFKDKNDDLSYNAGFYDSENPPPDGSGQYGVYLSGMATSSTSGEGWYGDGGIYVDVDVDGSALWVPFKGVIPTWDPISGDWESTGGDPDEEDADADFESGDSVFQTGSGQQPLPPMSNFGSAASPVAIELTHANYDDVDIIIDSRRPKFRMLEFPPTVEEVSSGSMEHDTYRLRTYGLVKPGKTYTVATIKVKVGVEEDDSREYKKTIKKHIPKAPQLKTKVKGLFSKVVKKERINNKISCWYIDLIYKPKRKILNPRENKLPVEIIVETKDFPSGIKLEHEITGLGVGKRKVGNGEERDITVLGSAGSDFCVMVNEVTLEEERTEDESILSNQYLDKVDWYGKRIRSVVGKIPNKGLFTFKQKFPSNVVKSAKINDSRGMHRNTIVFEDVKGIKAGDFLYGTTKTGFSYPERLAKVTDVSSKTVTFDATIHASNIPDNSICTFKRNRKYIVQVVQEHSSSIGQNVEIKKVLNQYDKPKITIDHTMSASNYKVLSANGLGAPGLSAGVAWPYVVSDSDFDPAKKKTQINISMVLKLTTGSHRWTSFKVAKHLEASKWDGVYDSGGKPPNKPCVVITNAACSTLNVNDEITFSYTATVLDWGKEDLTIECDLDNIFGITT